MPSPAEPCPSCGRRAGPAPGAAVPDLDLPAGPAAPPPSQPGAPLRSSMREIEEEGAGGPALELDDTRGPASQPGPASHPGAPASQPGAPASHPGGPASHPGVPASHPGVPASHPGGPASHPGGPASDPAVGGPPSSEPAPSAPKPPPPPPTPAQIVAQYPAAPGDVWGAPQYAIRVLLRQFQLRQDLTSLRRRRSPDVPLYEAALHAHDHRAFALGLGMSLAGLTVACLFVALPVIARFVMAP
jgi:hypothetical protein